MKILKDCISYVEPKINVHESGVDVPINITQEGEQYKFDIYRYSHGEYNSMLALSNAEDITALQEAIIDIYAMLEVKNG